MIQIKNTPHFAGVTISGDVHDMEALYESLHTIVGEEMEWGSYAGARIRVLGLCYDLRHAIMGDRELTFVDNGMDEYKMKKLSVVANDKNIYLSCNILWPELLFVTMALNDFVKLYADKQAVRNYQPLMDYRNIWDNSIATVRNFQASIVNCIKETIPATSINRILKLMNVDYTWSARYATQYLDELNYKFIVMDSEKRHKNITIMVKRIAEQGREYQDVKEAVLEAARDYNCDMTEIIYDLEYPETIEW
ncbi:hypothetical protein GGQ92_001486 [Gracilibacillus halotolerans]|uniref:Uncharacterized protein n=1 Tax=Gracilibacillus halotolerans TaxID=74386 RepID=A0A841RF71_9BACI|nr:hypothetical protein [Gracilibacillus halotolerans]MBB6512700.1 hypothetical protein [Gracilibacillus halotolerans]